MNDKVRIGMAEYPVSELPAWIHSHSRLLMKANADVEKSSARHQPADSTRNKRTTTYARLQRAIEYRDRIADEIEQMASAIGGDGK